MSFGLRFWGVRGSIACPSPSHVRYGGNTSCLEVLVNDQPIILDAGTGIRSLGHSIFKRGMKRAPLLLTHSHWDHINGFPFFAPAFTPGHEFQIYAGHLESYSIREVLAGQMTQPTFPVPLETMKAELAFNDFDAGDSFELFPDVRVRTASLNHPNGATGYRIEHGGRSICYVTDTEHVPGQPDQNILGLIEGADLVVYDATYTDEEFPRYVGWGHSTWQEAIRLCRAADVKKLAIFHHDPEHDDEFMDQVAADARRTWSGAIVAKEGMEIEL
ncbi:MAG: MBL fold metallo-hydrolase [Polyangiaceae bacterium]|nr:MBL fold metallo-hydrolase [Polyangiaceae bacterium]